MLTMPVMVCAIPSLALAPTLALPFGEWLLPDDDTDGARTPVATLCSTAGVSLWVVTGLLPAGERRSANVRKSSAGNFSKTRWRRGR